MPAELTGGVEYTHNFLSDKYATLHRDIRQTTAIVGGFLQNEWKSEKFGILCGARLDGHSLMKNPVLSPRGTLRYNMTEKVNLRASYSSGYRAPQAYNEDLHIDAVGGTLGLIVLDPQLKPEYSHSVSASLDLYHNIGNVHGNLLIESFYTVLNDVFMLEKTGEDEVGNFVYTRRNASGAVVRGFNLEAKTGIANRFDLQLGYTLQQSRYKQPEQWSEGLTPQRKIFRAPDSYGYFVADFTLSHHWKASLFGNYTGSMLVKHTLDGVDMEKNTPDFFDLGTKLSYHFHLSSAVELEINAGAKNIFNSFQRDLDFGQNKDAAYTYGPASPRLFFMGLKFSM
jgi:outer membrane receptor for ferrienterochelin and colicins